MLVYFVKKQTGILRRTTDVAIINNVSTTLLKLPWLQHWKDSLTYRNVLLLHCSDFQGISARLNSCLTGKVKKPHNGHFEFLSERHGGAVQTPLISWHLFRATLASMIPEVTTVEEAHVECCLGPLDSRPMHIHLCTNDRDREGECCGL